MSEPLPSSQKQQQILLVGGAMRSGTTVIHRALCTATNSNPYISESWFLHDLMNLYRWNLSRYEVRHADQFGNVRNFRELIRFNFQYYLNMVSARYADPDVLILKHPELTRHFIEIAAMFPGMKFLAIVRDPRDVIASMKDVTVKHRESGIVSPQSQVTTVEGYCRQYASYYERILQAPKWLNERLTYVRYEDAMKNPRALATSVSDFVGASYMPEEVGRFTEQHAESANFRKELRLKDSLSGAFWSDLYIKDFSTEQIGRYLEKLDKDEIALIERFLRPIGERFQYWG